MTNIREIKREPKNKEVLDTLELARKTISKADSASSFMLMVKVDNQYMRFSSRISDVMELISQLELMKHDCMQRMEKVIDDETET